MAAASQCVPCIRIKVAKHWWTANLDDLKQQCTDICNLWKLVGCPRNGTINSERLRVKYRYKQAIKQAIIDADTGVNEDLYDRLCKKDVNSFWKSWRKKFCSRNIKPTIVLNGKQGDKNIAHEFTEYHRKVYQPNTFNAESVFQNEANNRLAECLHGDRDMESYNIDMSCIMSHISRLKCNKSAGHDGIVSEHVV